MFLLNLGCLTTFELIGTNVGMIILGFSLLFGVLTIFIIVIEKHFLKKIQKHEKQKFGGDKSKLTSKPGFKSCNRQRNVRIRI